MSDIAIRVDQLSKLYPSTALRAGRIGQRQQRHDTLRDALASVFSRQLPSPIDHRPLKTVH